MRTKAAVWAAFISQWLALEADASTKCTPALPFYCENIHIGCAGRSKISTQGFTFREQSVVFENGTVWNVRPREDRKALILWRQDNDDWIRIEENNRFSLRRYDHGRALMMRGHCRHVPDATR
jgi:hypothetical protein